MYIERGKRKQMWEYSVNAQDDIRRAYLKVGPYQPKMDVYPVTKFGTQNRSFQKRWFDNFHWLEYSPSTNKAYCFYCFLFMSDVNMPISSALVKEGFNNWKRISQGNRCAFLTHVGFAATSPHTMCLRRVEDLMRPSVTCKVFECLIEHSQNGRAKAEIQGAYKNMANFESVFTLHLIHKIMRVTDSLCQILQRKVQDILAAITFVSTTKTILQELRESGWELFLEEVKVFCLRNGIDVPNLDDQYKVGRSRGQITIEHHYHFDVFNGAIDCILMELNTRFNDASIELLSFSVALDPKNSFQSFNSDDICKLARKFYPEDFSDQDIVCLEYELDHYKHDVMMNQEFQVSTLVELSQLFSKIGRSKIYIMLTRLIHLVLTLPVSTATTERAFSAMKHVKTALRNKMGDDLLGDCLMIYIERDFVKNIDIDSIIDEFYVLKSRRTQLK